MQQTVSCVSHNGFIDLFPVTTIEMTMCGPSAVILEGTVAELLLTAP